MSGDKRAKFVDDRELRRGPWTLEEDSLLIHYIARHGEGRWNLLARSSGLKRTGKSCRLRWLNYLKPDVKRGNLTPEEQYLILELHSKWGNRWSRIAQYLPGRTDNEIKNYWRTRVQKQARQLKIDVNSALFRDAVRCFWMPRLLEKINFNEPNSCSSSSSPQTLVIPSNNYTSNSSTSSGNNQNNTMDLSVLLSQQLPEVAGVAGSDEILAGGGQVSGEGQDDYYEINGRLGGGLTSFSGADCMVSGGDVDWMWGSSDDLWHLTESYVSGVESEG